MSTPSALDRIRRAMSDTAFFPHPVASLQFRETHISLVVLTGSWVYKLKKPVNFGFLDFQTLANREYFCRQEMTLNQRLSSGIYCDVVAIHEAEDGRLSLEPIGRIVEYAVKMKQLPEHTCLEAMLLNQGVTSNQITVLGEMLAAFHARAETTPDISSFGHPDVIRYNMEENFTQIAPFVGHQVPGESWEFFCQVWRSFWKNHQTLFQHRVQTGKIRDGHGDLRADHVYFHDGVQVIDCIEFNQRFRYGDIALDLAFLLMDLDRRGHDAVAGELLASYAKWANDPEIYALVDFYAAYRALVRAKVAGLSLAHATPSDRITLEGEMRDYLRQACLYAFCFGRPTLWIFCGLPASGKSSLAAAITQNLFMPLYQSDIVRRDGEHNEDSSVVPFQTGMYRPVLRGRVYAKMLNLAQDHLKSGQSVALDATFSQQHWRAAAGELARDINVGIVFIECTCSPDTIKARLKGRENRPGASDARLSHFDDMRAAYEPFPDDLQHLRLSIDTGQSVDMALFEALQKAHALRRAQARIWLDAMQ